MAKRGMAAVCAWGAAVFVLAGAVAYGGGGENRAAEAEGTDEGRGEAWLVARMAVRAGYLAAATGWSVAKNLPRLLRGQESHAGEYGPAFNGERGKLGVPEIPADWVLKEDGEQCFTYGLPSAEGGWRAEITVWCDRKTGAISSEEHRYYSGRTFSVEGEGDDWPEYVLFRYTYGEPEKPWRFFYDHDANCPECREKGRDLGPEGFDALLEEWGFERVFAPAVEGETLCPDPGIAQNAIKVSWPAPADTEWDNLPGVAVLRALEWLRLNQSQDGSWSHSEKPADRVAFASLGLLAFLSHGETTLSEKYGETVTRALKFLVANQNGNGEFVSTEDAAGAYAHAMAVCAVAEAYGMMRIPDLRPFMEKGVQVLIDGQHDRGGFAPGFAGSKFAAANATEVRRRQLRDLRDTALCAWCCHAMHTSRECGAFNPGLAEAMDKAAADLLRASCPEDGAFFSGGTTEKPGGKRDFTTTAMAVSALQWLGHGRDNEVRRGLLYLQDARCDWDHPGEWPMLGWYFTTKAKYCAGGVGWTKWQAESRPQFVHNQTRNDNPAENGSWTSPGTSLSEGHGGREDFDRVYATALAALTLQPDSHCLGSRLPLDALPPPEDGGCIEITIF